MGNGSKERVWNVFRKYHYLNSDMHVSAAQYVGLMNGNTLVCHTGVLHAAMMKGVKRVHRLVVLPPYQGIGIGTAFLRFVAQQYPDYTFNLITTTPALRHAIEKDKDHWILRRSGKVHPPSKASLKEGKPMAHIARTLSCNRLTWSFDFINNNIKKQLPPEKDDTFDEISLF